MSEPPCASTDSTADPAPGQVGTAHCISVEDSSIAGRCLTSDSSTDEKTHTYSTPGAKTPYTERKAPPAAGAAVRDAEFQTCMKEKVATVPFDLTIASPCCSGVMVWGLGFRVWGLWVRVRGLGCRVEGLVLKV